MLPRLSCLFACGLLLACCETVPTVYGPAAGPQAVGFSEYRIEPGRYRITFQGGPGAPVAQVSDYALRRAAELALAEGYDWFRVADRVTEASGYHRGSRISVGAGGADFGRRSAVGVGIGTSFNLGGGPTVAQTLEVVMGRGEAPRGGDVYDAREIRRSLGSGR